MFPERQQIHSFCAENNCGLALFLLSRIFLVSTKFRNPTKIENVCISNVKFVLNLTVIYPNFQSNPCALNAFCWCEDILILLLLNITHYPPKYLKTQVPTGFSWEFRVYSGLQQSFKPLESLPVSTDPMSQSTTHRVDYTSHPLCPPYKHPYEEYKKPEEPMEKGTTYRSDYPTVCLIEETVHSVDESIKSNCMY